MSSAIFGEDVFSEESNGLYEKVVSDEAVARELFLLERHNLPTGSHSRGVARLVAELAFSNIIDLDQVQKELFVRSAVLHDLGKTSISKSILSKVGKLNGDEWAEVREHSVDGFYQYCVRFSDVSEGLPILLHHTMQMDGYPSTVDQKQAISSYSLLFGELNDESVLTKTAILAIADNLEARYPIVDISHPLIGTRSYNHRQYMIDELPQIVRAGFIESGVIRNLGLSNVLDETIEASQEILLKIHQKPPGVDSKDTLH